jgi:1-deoxy-D-xylulose-5-phosphate reductoisomerase
MGAQAKSANMVHNSGVRNGVMRRVTVLGSTGSIGRTALDVIGRLNGEVSVAGLSARSNLALFAEQVRAVRPEAVAIESHESARTFRALVPEWRGDVLAGPEGLAALAAGTTADLVLVGVVGAAGLAPTLAALAGGKDIALATKEVLVAGGALVTEAASRAGRRILPVDSEHSAIFQCLAGQRPETVARLWLTASGGPFLRLDAAALDSVTPADALRHPTWKMGPKVTIDSATLMNKGLEVIEAHWLFAVPPDGIEVVIHPQSVVHSLVEFVDGSFLAQLGATDMHLPIQYALTFPRRLPGTGVRLDLRTAGSLAFEAPDPVRFPCLGYARTALDMGGTAPAALNAANEVSVRLFLEGRMRFPDLARNVRKVLDHHTPRPATSLDAILDADREARAQAAVGWTD